MPERPRKIGLFLNFRDNSYQQATFRAAAEAARRHRVELQVFFAENLAVQQSHDIIRFVHDNAEKQLAVIVTPVADIRPAAQSVLEHPLHSLARRVAAKGAAWLILNREAEAHVKALREEYPQVSAGIVTVDQRGFGRLQGRQFKALLPRGGHLLYVVGSSVVSSSQARRAGMLEETAQAGLALDELEGGWTVERARDAVSRRLLRANLRATWPDLIGCQNDEMAMGAREALLRAAGDLGRPSLARLPVTGGDGLPDGGQRWVAEGKLAATVVLPAVGGVAVDGLIQEWNGGSPMPLATLLPVTSLPPIERLAPPPD